MTDDDLAFADLPTLRGHLTAKRVSSVELTNLFVKRLETYGPVYNAVAAITHDRALREAKRADDERARGRVRGPLHGIPFGVKDLLATPDAPTTWGAEPYRNQRFDFDATAVQRLANAGAILVAKLAMVELAGGFGYGSADASWTGPGRTPWNARYWSGGSSSGPGAAVAAGLVPFAIGSETSGSILTPSSACGITGLRPTYGRVSRHGAMALSWSLDKLGPMARTAADAATVLRAIAGRDPLDPTSTDAPFAVPKRKLRIATLRDGTANVMPEVKANFEAALAVLARTHDVAGEIALPEGPWGAVVGAVVNAEGASAFRDLIESGRARTLRDPDDRLGGYAAYATAAVDYLDAQRRRGELVAALERAMAPYDAIATPTRTTLTYRVGIPFGQSWPGFGPTPSLIAPGNLAGLPAITLPNGFGRENLPTGIALLGAAWSEAMLAALGTAYQSQTDFHTRRPPLVTKVPA